MITAAHRWGMAMVAVVGLALLSLSLGAPIATAQPRHTLAAGRTCARGRRSSPAAPGWRCASPVWETGTTFPNSFATVSGFGSLQLYAR
jgi:hypothetical protein